MQCSRCQAANRDRERAVEHINAATAMYREMDMTFWIDPSATTAGLSTVH